jgi:nucleolar MIF4G domain-containing protein 1
MVMGNTKNGAARPKSQVLVRRLARASKRKLVKKRRAGERRPPLDDDDDDDPAVQQPNNSSTRNRRVASNQKREVDRCSEDSMRFTKGDEDPTKRQRQLDWSATTRDALRRDDEEIAALERKLGLTNNKVAGDANQQKNRLYKEYAKLECYGDDFGEFLEDLDGMVDRVINGSSSKRKNNRTVFTAMHSSSEASNDESFSGSGADNIDLDDEEEDEEVVPMKGPAIDDIDEDDSVSVDLEVSERDYNDTAVPDHAIELTYQPTQGEDIYGNTLVETGGTMRPTRYVPPHLRKAKKDGSKDSQLDDKARQEALSIISRSLNNPLNRLSEDTLVSVAQAIAKLYPLHPTSDVNECIWKITKNSCIARSHSMVGLIPVYIAALCGVHFIKGDAVQVGEYIMEKVVLNLWRELQSTRDKSLPSDDPTVLISDDDLVAKETSNLTLCLCYLYNFGVVHCSLLYDIVRDLIASFKPIDIESLLLILNHCGRALRSDDPLALKEIVLLVQKRALETRNNESSKIHASHVDYMMSSIMDLKNNKRQSKSTAYAEKTTRLRKILGQIKSIVALTNGGFRSESSLRLSLSDLLDAEVNGRYWKIGASWVGNQYRCLASAECDDATNLDDNVSMKKSAAVVDGLEEDTKLQKLATKCRMNTDIRRSIFYIIMGSADCDDAFEKLIKAEMLKNRTERETVRVLMDCCGNEKSFNKYYSHLACRICEFQPQAKFSFQLAFWDAFKTIDSTEPRKSANLAKLLFYLVAVHFSLRLNVLKAIDLSSPEELSEPAMIFVTIFLSSMLEHFDDPSDLVRLVEKGGIRNKHASSNNNKVDDDMGHMDDGEALCANLTVFFVQVLKASPKYKKGSKFRANLKAAVKACDTDNFF